MHVLQQLQRPIVVLLIQHTQRGKKDGRRHFGHRVIRMLVADEIRYTRFIKDRLIIADLGWILMDENLAHSIQLV